MTIQKFSTPRGTADILPDEIFKWQKLESSARNLLSLYGYKEIRTPFFEDTNLFARSLGSTTDVVQKQMLNLMPSKEKSNDDEKNGFSLRPEATASIVRSYIEHAFAHKERLTKLYYIGPMFRGERPQKGRLRQFHQIGVEAIGPDSFHPFLDAEMISLSVKLLNQAGLKDFKLKINSLGSAEDKKNLSGVLREKLKKDLSRLCVDCQQRFERNVFRILDCKNRDCREIVKQLNFTDEHLSAESKKYFKDVQESLSALGIAYEVSPLLVRGLDYYTHTVFEISHSGLGSQDAVGAGGRYNQLVQELGGDPKGEIGAIGFALGIERMLLAQPENVVEKETTDVFIVALDSEGQDQSFRKAFEILNEIRGQGVSAEMSYARNSMKSQMRQADKLGAKHVMILGENEIKENAVALKNMQSGIQEKISLDHFSQIVSTIKKMN